MTPSQKPSLAQAMNRYHYVVRKLGMAGQSAPHSLRYAYATAHLERMKDAGTSAPEAASAVSTYLGHGDGRGRWVIRVYGRDALTESGQ
ncbi:integrase domain-containing protein [Cupriavidus basilensis]